MSEKNFASMARASLPQILSHPIVIKQYCLILHVGLDAKISRCFLVYQWLNTNSIFCKYKFLYSISFTLKGHRKYLIVK